MTNDNSKENSVTELLRELSVISLQLSEGLEMLDGHVDDSGAGTFLIVTLKRETRKLLEMADDIKCAIDTEKPNRKAA